MEELGIRERRFFDIHRWLENSHQTRTPAINFTGRTETNAGSVLESARANRLNLATRLQSVTPKVTMKCKSLDDARSRGKQNANGKERVHREWLAFCCAKTANLKSRPCVSEMDCPRVSRARSLSNDTGQVETRKRQLAEAGISGTHDAYPKRQRTRKTHGLTIAGRPARFLASATPRLIRRLRLAPNRLR